MRRWRRGGQAAGEAAWAPHELRGGQLMAQLDDPVLAGGSFGREQLLHSRDWVERVVAQPPETVGSVLMLLVRRASGRGGSWWLRQQAGELAKRRHVVSADDALLAARTVLRASDDWYAGGLLRAVEGMLRRTIGPLARDEASAGVIASCSTRSPDGVTWRPRTAARCGPGCSSCCQPTTAAPWTPP